MEYITGASGFIGSRLKGVLTEAECVPHVQLADFVPRKYDYFYFLSSYGNMADQKDVDETIRANLYQPVDIVRRSPAGFKSFVYFSSSSVRLSFQTVYSRAKRAAEEVLLSQMESLKLPICIIRPFSVTGVGEQPKHLIPTLIRSCLEGETINFVEEPTHDFIDVADVVNGTLNLALNRARGIYELGTGRKYSNKQVLEIVEDITQRKAKVNVVPSMRSYDNEDWVCTNFKARSWGWLPQKSLEQSIKEMVTHYKANAQT